METESPPSGVAHDALAHHENAAASAAQSHWTKLFSQLESSQNAAVNGRSPDNGSPKEEQNEHHPGTPPEKANTITRQESLSTRMRRLSTPQPLVLSVDSPCGSPTDTRRKSHLGVVATTFRNSFAMIHSPLDGDSSPVSSVDESMEEDTEHDVSEGADDASPESSRSDYDEEGRASVKCRLRRRMRRNQDKIAKRKRAVFSAARQLSSSRENGTRKSDGTRFRSVATTVMAGQKAANKFRSGWAVADPQQDWEVVGGVHVTKKKLHLQKFLAEYRSRKRDVFYQELVLYLFVIFVLISLFWWLPIKDSYEQNDVMADLLCTKEGEGCQFDSIPAIYEYLHGVEDDLCRDGDSQTSYARWQRLGTIRVSQVRVVKEQCSVAESLSFDCYQEFNLEREERAPFPGPATGHLYEWSEGGTDMKQPNGLWIEMASVLPEWLYQEQDTDDVHGGYTSHLCAQGTTTVAKLEQDQWIGSATRAISISFTLVNPATRVFTVGVLQIEIGPSGHIDVEETGAHMRLLSRSLDGEKQNEDRTMIVLWLLLVGYFSINTVSELRNMRKMGFREYIQVDFWNLFEMIQTLLMGQFICSSLYFYCKSSEALERIPLMLRSPPHYVALLDVMHSYLEVADLCAVNALLGMLKVFRFLRMNTTLNLLWASLGMATKDLAAFMVIFMLIFLAYAVMGCLAFGFHLEEFHTFTNSFSTCFQMLAGDFNYEKLRNANPRLAPLFFGSFVVLCLQILVNMFVAILSEYYEKAKEISAVVKGDVEYDVYRRVMDFLRSMAPRVVLSHPLQLRHDQTVRLISTNLMDREVKRQRARKKFRGAVWRVLALLRFGVKFDRRLLIDSKEGAGRRGRTVSDDSSFTCIPLSEDFDHKTIREMLPTGITVRLQGDSLIGDDISLKVLQHSALSTECRVVLDASANARSWSDWLSSSSSSSSSPSPVRSPKLKRSNSVALELVGGEKLVVPWKIFVLHVGRSLLGLLRKIVLQFVKVYDPLSFTLIDDYHLYRLLAEAQEEDEVAFRFDELHRKLDLFIRKRQANRNVSAATTKRETALVMYHYRQSLIDLPSREKEGQNYKPRPLKTDNVDLGSLEYLADLLAENCHELWAQERIRQGWTYGSQRDDEHKKHPNLVPYDWLTEEEKMYDRRTSIESIKTILVLQFRITRSANAKSAFSNGTGSKGMASIGKIVAERRQSGIDPAAVQSLPPGSVVSRDGAIYTPRPVDTSNVELPQRLLALADLIAENAHEVWSKGRMDEGWTFGPQRDDKNKKHPCLVPYIYLTQEEQEYDLNTALGTLKMLLAMGFEIHDKTA